jgi:hypothetical protein
MNDTPLGRFFGVVTRPRTWLNLLFQVLAFPLGLFYFIFLVTGLSVGLGLVIIWVGIPILLVVAGAWWLFGAFERLQARVLLGADVPDAPRSWEKADGIWGKVKAHFGNGSTWKDLLYLLAKLAFGVVSFTLVVTFAGMIGWFFFLPLAAVWHVGTIDFGSGAWIPPAWLALLGIPAGVLMIFVSLHLLNAWGWVCARWAEVMFRMAPQAPVSSAPPAPLVSTSPQPAVTAPAPPAPPALAEPVTAAQQIAGTAPPALTQPPVAPAPPAVTQPPAAVTPPAVTPPAVTQPSVAPPPAAAQPAELAGPVTAQAPPAEVTQPTVAPSVPPLAAPPLVPAPAAGVTTEAAPPSVVPVAAEADPQADSTTPAPQPDPQTSLDATD